MIDLKKSQKGISITYIAKTEHKLFPVVTFSCYGFLYQWIPEAEFMNVQFRWGFWAWSWEFSDLRCPYTLLTLQTR